MPNKFLTIGVAAGVAALVLLLSVLIGGPRTEVQTDQPDEFDPDKIYLPSSTGDGQVQVGEVEDIVYEVSDSGILFFANRVVPKPQGVIDVLKTTAQIHLAAGRELTIVADEGTIVAPDNHPREGEMRGNVVVTLYETPDGSPVDFDSDRHVVIRMYFEDPVQFDLELQQIDSEGGLFMTGPQVQFRGRGLSLNYNQLKHRIERLVIEEGESLHYIPEPEAVDDSPIASSSEAIEADPSTLAAHDVPESGDSIADAKPATDTSSPDTDAGGRPIQFYLATFEELDDVRVGQDQYVIEGDDLSAIFSAKSAKGEDDDSDPDSTAHKPGHGPAGLGRGDSDIVQGPPTLANRSIELASSDPLRSALLHALAASIGQVPEKDPRSLATFTDEDVVITWAGRLVVSPLSDPPDEIAGPDDIRISVRGAPTKIRTENGETIDAPEVSFLSQNARLLARGNEESPVHVNAPEMGELIGRELSIDQLNANGYVVGPGRLTGEIKQDPEDETPTTDTRPISVAFDHRLDLEFYLKDKDESSAPDPSDNNPAGDSRIKSVKTAAFTGNVRIDYTELKMTADSLTLAMLEDAPEGEDKLAVSELDAEGNIKADVIDQDVKIEAHRLHAEPARDQLELFGRGDVLARVIRPDATLAGDHILMDQHARTVTVMGPGWFDVMQDPDDPGKTVRVTWATRMDYDDAAGTATFLGDVKTLSTDGTDTNELMGDQLDMVFVKDETKDDSKKDTDTDRTAGRRLATAHMTGTVRFRARSYATANHQQLLTELFMLGPEMRFTDPAADGSDDKDAIQQVQVIGTGRMLLTDTRPKDSVEATITPASQSSVDLAGRGKTAFQWSDRLVLNLSAGIMTMKGAVVMVHDPEDGERVQLDCTDLAAELKQPREVRTSRKAKSSGGWLDKDAPKPELERVWADGGIRILQGPTTVYCDHLLYEEDSREMLIWSDDPRTVTVQVEGEPNVAKASAFKWHRDTNRREAFKIRSGTIPIRRGE